MTFYDKKDLSNLISNYSFTDNNYIINYLNGDYIKYYNSNNNHYKELNKKMLEQAKDRDRKLYCYYKKINNARITLTILISILGIGFILNNLIISLLCISFICIINDYVFINKYRELKKYHNYLEIEKKLNNNKCILKKIGYDTIYDIPLDINTLDYYYYKKIKKIKKYILKNM